MQSEEAQRTGAVLDSEAGQWRVHYDPTNTFQGYFSHEDFRHTLERGYWPYGIVFYNTKSGHYYQVVQKLRRFEKKYFMKQQVGLMKRRATMQKPPVSERKVYR